MPAFNKEKLAEMVAEESRIEKELQDCSLALNDQHATDKSWTDEMLAKYAVDNHRHGQLTRELGTVRAQRQHYELQEPERAKVSFNSVTARFLREGADGLEESERKLYMPQIKDPELVGVIPSGGSGSTMTIMGATRSDDDSGKEASQEDRPPQIIDRLAFYGGVARMSQQFMTGHGGEYRIMQMDEATKEGHIIGSQNTDANQGATQAQRDLADIGVIGFQSKTCTSRSIGLTLEMVQDAVFDITSYVERQAVRRMGRTWNRAFTVTGNGAGMPEGVVSKAKAGITTAAETAVTWKELTNLIYEVNRAYREEGESGEGGFMAEQGGTIGYMMSDAMEKLVRVLTDSDGRPLWVPSTREGVPSMLNGYPYQVNGHMDAVTAGKIPLLFGNFSYYGIRTIKAIQIYRFQDSRTMQNHAIECLGYSRRDGRYLGAMVDFSAGNDGSDIRCEAVAKLTMKP